VVSELRLAIKMTIGGTAAWWIATQLGAQRPIFAALVPLVALSGDPFGTVLVSLGRILGVFAGVGLGIAVLHVHAPTTTKVAVALAVSTVVAIVVRIGDRPNLEVPIAALFMLGFPGSRVAELGLQRIWETAVGGAVAILVSTLLWPPDPIRELERRLERLRQQLASDFAAVADDLATGSGATSAQLDDLREHSLDAVRDVFALDPARQAIRWSPLRRSDAAQLDDYARRIGLAARVARHARAIGRDVADAPVRDAALAAATRDLADAADRALRDRDHLEPLARAGAALSRASDPILAAQLRQLRDDLS